MDTVAQRPMSSCVAHRKSTAPQKPQDRGSGASTEASARSTLETLTDGPPTVDTTFPEATMRYSSFSLIATLALLPLTTAGCGEEQTNKGTRSDATGAGGAGGSGGAGDGGNGAGGGSSATMGAGGSGGAPQEGVVRVVVFTHIEDNTPAGQLPSPGSSTAYLGLRDNLIQVAELAQARGLPWVLQPDWKFLEAALLYEDAATMATTGGKNLLQYLHEDLGVAIDPHSHENGGYNYTDVAYLLEQLGVGGSTVIGGHIWDPSLPEFQHWERFRDPVAGLKYPSASWRGDILIGAGTPNHVNDPLVSGLWHPKDPEHFFEDDPAGNIVAVGAWHDDLAGVDELVALYADGTVPPTTLLTASWNLMPASITAAGGPANIDTTLFAPLQALQASGVIEVTDFTSLVATWQSAFGGEAGLYAP